MTNVNQTKQDVVENSSRSAGNKRSFEETIEKDEQGNPIDDLDADDDDDTEYIVNELRVDKDTNLAYLKRTELCHVDLKNKTKLNMSEYKTLERKKKEETVIKNEEGIDDNNTPNEDLTEEQVEILRQYVIEQFGVKDENGNLVAPNLDNPLHLEQLKDNQGLIKLEPTVGNNPVANGFVRFNPTERQKYLWNPTPKIPIQNLVISTFMEQESLPNEVFNCCWFFCDFLIHVPRLLLFLLDDIIEDVLPASTVISRYRSILKLISSQYPPRGTVYHEVTVENRAGLNPNFTVLESVTKKGYPPWFDLGMGIMDNLSYCKRTTTDEDLENMMVSYAQAFENVNVKALDNELNKFVDWIGDFKKQNGDSTQQENLSFYTKVYETTRTYTMNRIIILQVTILKILRRYINVQFWEELCFLSCPKEPFVTDISRKMILESRTNMENRRLLGFNDKYLCDFTDDNTNMLEKISCETDAEPPTTLQMKKFIDFLLFHVTDYDDLADRIRNMCVVDTTKTVAKEEDVRQEEEGEKNQIKTKGKEKVDEDSMMFDNQMDHKLKDETAVQNPIEFIKKL